MNGKRTTHYFVSQTELLRWAEEDIDDEDDILLITQGGIFIYSGLQSNAALTRGDITGFFG